MRFKRETTLTLTELSQLSALGLAIVFASVISLSPVPVSAKKSKKPKISDEEVKAAVDPIQKTVLEITNKLQTRLLLTPAENGKLDELKWQLMDLMAQYGKSNLMVQPVYQAAVLFERREYFQDAYDMYSFLEENHPDNPVTVRAKLNKQKLIQRYGQETFALAPSDSSGQAGPPAVAKAK